MARNYLLGGGERLTSAIPPIVAGRPRPSPYTPQQAAARLAPQLRGAVSQFRALPPEACPRDEAVAIVTLHPQYTSKSEFPAGLLDDAGLRAVGSRAARVVPEAWTRAGEPQEVPTVDLFVAGGRDRFDAWQEELGGVARGGAARSRAAGEAYRVEGTRAPGLADTVRGFTAEADADDAQSDRDGGLERAVEAVLHAGRAQAWVLEAFEAYLATLELRPDTARVLFTGGLCFVPLFAPVELLGEVSRFAFLRAARPAPQLRSVVTPGVALPGEAPGCELPDEGPVREDLRIAVFDGGIRDGGPLAPWARPVAPAGIGDPLPELVDHGEGVTSAVLFGPLVPGRPAPRPYAAVDHHRVLDEQAVANPLELTDALIRIQDVLASGLYEFANISFGPDAPVDDADISSWTAVLDELLGDGKTLLALAAGNYRDPDLPAAHPLRVLLPGDAVNALTVGAADSAADGPWRRASYSARGPGRSPGVVKPDLLAFGGAAAGEAFYVVDSEDPDYTIAVDGTSVASPAALRLAAGARAVLGPRLSPLALKALLVHTAQDHPDGPTGRAEHGWGRAAATVEDLLVCAEHEVRVVYQDTLRAGGFLRCPIPMPSAELRGRVRVTATLSYACATDPQDAPAYTRAGLETFLRPHAGNYQHGLATSPKTASFFNVAQLGAPGLHPRAHLWETTMRRSQRFLPSSLLDPVLDLHHNARQSGAAARAADDIPFALIVSVMAPRMPGLYDDIVAKYRTQLEVLVPEIEIEVQT